VGGILHLSECLFRVFNLKILRRFSPFFLFLHSTLSVWDRALAVASGGTLQLADQLLVGQPLAMQSLRGQRESLAIVQISVVESKTL
jgi:hypothetical protein